MFIHQEFTVPNLIQTGYLAFIKQKKLISQLNIDKKYYQNRTALHIAIISNQIQITQWLLSQYQPNLQSQDSLGLKPIHWLNIKTNQHNNKIFLSIIEKYFHTHQYKQKLTHQYKQKHTHQYKQKHTHQYKQKQQEEINIPINKLNICLAAQLSLKQLQLIFNNNKNIYLKTHFNRKAHHWAAISGNVQLFNLLLQHQFDPYQQDLFGFNSYHYILINPNNPIYKTFHHKFNLIKNNLTFQTKPNHYQAIIIGAGAAGIAAAITLSKAGLPYLVLQARQRVGGRILSKSINQIQIDLGASWVHSCSKNNSVWKQAKKLNWKTKTTLPYTDSLILSQFQQQFSQKDIHHSMILSQTYFAFVQQHTFNSQNDTSIQQAGRQFYQSHIAILDPIKKSLVDMFINMIQHYNAAEVQKLSAKFYDEQEDIGQNWLPQQSYFKLIQAIGKSINFQKRVKFGTLVKQIIYKNESQYNQIITQNGQTFYAKKIISSLPLGILKANKVKFTPPMPQEHQKSIDKLGWGIMNKIILSVDKPFWKQHPCWLRIACEQKGKFPAIYNFSTENKHILCCFITDKFAHQMSQKTDQQIMNQLLLLLQKVSKKQQIKVIDYVITRWDQDPYSLGSYSHFGVGSNMETTRKLRRNIEEKLWIVGQHCYGEHIGCAHGAFQTGVWASQQILSLIKKVDKSVIKKVDKII